MSNFEKLKKVMGDFKNTVMNIDPMTHLQNMSNYMDDNTKFIMAIVFLIIVSVYILYRINYILHRKHNKQCYYISNIYSTNTKIKPISSTDSQWQKPLNYYYIKTSYNSCSIGSYKDGFVDDFTISDCILNAVIGQGVRSFDFEIFNINNEAVVSTSADAPNPNIKSTYNYVPFYSVLNYLVTNAIVNQNNSCPNPTDPLFISLRMNTNNEQVYNNISSYLQEYTNTYLLTPEYNCSNTSDFGLVPLNTLIQKMVIIVYPTNSTILQSTKLYEFTNINGWGSQTFNYMNYYNVVNDDSDDTLTTAKTTMIYVKPTLVHGTPTNPDPSFCLSLGIQFIGMSYQIFDNFLKAYEYFFDTAGNAFVMKNPSLLPITFVIDVPDIVIDPLQTCLTIEANGVSQTFGDCNADI